MTTPFSKFYLKLAMPLASHQYVNFAPLTEIGIKFRAFPIDAYYNNHIEFQTDEDKNYALLMCPEMFSKDNFR